jgi:hypothetical protein
MDFWEIFLMLKELFENVHDAQRGERGEGGLVNIPHPLANFKTLVNKNAIKPEIGGPPPGNFS